LFETDVAVVGGGPAGSATAITCARAGLQVAVAERSAFPRRAPGETLHPGALPALRRLDVEDQVLAADFLRHEGHFVRWGGPERFVPFGRDGNGAWLGLQAWRPMFDAILLEQASRLGVRIEQPDRPRRVLGTAQEVRGIVTERGAIRARYVVDATGRRAWLAQQLGVRAEPHGPRLTAWYGYAEGHCPERDRAPALTADADGWTWVARIRPGTYQWTRLNFDGRRPSANWRPEELSKLRPCSRTLGADVSWRIASAPAGAGYFLVGDAAAVLDPASSHGVLKALMSGMMAGHLIVNVSAGKLQTMDAAALYTRWLRDWFEHDVRKLNELYSVLGRPLAGERPPVFVSSKESRHVQSQSKRPAPPEGLCEAGVQSRTGKP
jgi:flavin-dependent dehydrogenase